MKTYIDKFENSNVRSIIFVFIALILATPLLSYGNHLTETDCLVITSPPDFYYKSVILSWTPIIDGVDHYILEYSIGGQNGIIRLNDNWLRLEASDWSEWEVFASAGYINYRVSAVDADEIAIEGPTDWATFRCYLHTNDIANSLEERISALNRVQPECLIACNPPDFYYNTVLLSWTPIIGADHYKLNFVVIDRPFSMDIKNNWFRMTASNQDQWLFFVNIASIAYNIEAYDPDNNLIAGPTIWNLFVRK